MPTQRPALAAVLENILGAAMESAPADADGRLTRGAEARIDHFVKVSFQLEEAVRRLEEQEEEPERYARGPRLPWEPTARSGAVVPSPSAPPASAPVPSARRPDFRHPAVAVPLTKALRILNVDDVKIRALMDDAQALHERGERVPLLRMICSLIDRRGVLRGVRPDDPVRYAANPWAYDPGPRGGHRWRDTRTGKYRYSPTQPGPQDEGEDDPAEAPPAGRPAGAESAPHFRRVEQGFAAALGGAWNGAEDRRHPADVTVFARGKALYHVELKDRLDSERDTAAIDPNAALRKLEMMQASYDDAGGLIPFVTVLPMWRSNQGGKLGGIVVRFKLTFAGGEYREAVMPGLNVVDDLSKPTVQQRLRRLILAEVRQADMAEYERALLEQSEAAEEYFRQRLSRARKVGDAFRRRVERREET